MLFSLTTPALGADRASLVCRRIAASLRRGSGYNVVQGGRETLLEALAHHSRGRVLLATWDTQGSRRAAYLLAAGMQTEIGQAATAVARAGQLVAVMNSEGSASCTDTSLFLAAGHRLIRIVPPYVTRITSCARWGDRISLGSFAGSPFVAKETNDDMDIQVAPWNGHGWDAICSVVVRYRPEFVSEGALCRTTDCTGLENEVKRIAAQNPPEGAGYSYQQGRNPQLDHLVQLAEQTPGTDAIPSPPGWSGPNFTPPSLIPSMAQVDGRPALAIAGEWKSGPAGDSEPIGYAVALWQEAGDKLRLLAGFHLRTSHAAIKSVVVTR